MPRSFTIREERPGDEPGISALIVSAFPGDEEARLVDLLRRDARPLISLVAEDDSEILGHILFSPVTLKGYIELRLMGLAPMAVRPDRQRSGTGTALVEAGLDACRRLGIDAVVVLGHPGYYPRFGFAPASRFGLRCRWDVPDDVFMALELEGGRLRGADGCVEYHAAFDDL